MDNKLHRDVWVGSILFVFCLLILYFSLFISGQASYLPTALSIIMMVCALTIAINGFRKSKNMDSYHYTMTIKEEKTAFIFMTWIFLYYVGFKLLGYWVTTPIFLVLTQMYLKVKSWKTISLITVIYTIAVFVLFVVILKLPIYKIGLFGKYFRII